MQLSTVEKAIKIRANWIRRARRPHTAFSQRIHDALHLLAVVDKKGGDAQAAREARRNLVVALVAGFEIYWRETFRMLIDRHRIAPVNLKTLGKISFSPADVAIIVGRRLSIGELIACSHTFQSFEAVNRLASDMVGFDFFANFKSRTFRIAPADEKDRRVAPKDVAGVDIFKLHAGNVAKCLELRHNLAHDWPSRTSLTARTVQDFFGSMSTLNIFLGADLQWQLEMASAPEG